jgi:maltose-binding protein MalE
MFNHRFNTLRIMHRANGRNKPVIYFAIISLIIIYLILFSGCTEKKEKIMVWTSMRPVEQDVLDSLLQQFSFKYPDYDFSQLFYPNEEARINFIIAGLAGKGPDLLHGASDNIGPFTDIELIQPLESRYDSLFLDSFLREPFPANTWLNGHLYQIADRIGNHLCLVYNKDIISDPPATMSELIALGKTLQGKKIGEQIIRYILAWNYTEPYFAVPFIGGYGGWIVDDQLNPTLNTPATVGAAKLIYDLAHTFGVTPKECDYEIANALFKDGLSAMIINGPWSWGTYLSNGMNIGIARIPLIDETQLWPTPIVSPLGYSVNANLSGKKLEIVLDLLKYLTSKEAQLAYTRISGSIPSNREAYHSRQVTDNELLQQAIDQMEIGKPMPVVTKLRWMWDAMRPGFQGVFSGQLTPQEAAVLMQKRAEALIEENL